MKKKTKRKYGYKGAAVQGRMGDGAFKIILIVLGVIFVIMTMGFLYRINQGFTDYTSTPNDILRAMKNGYYDQAIDDMYDNIAMGETVSKNPDYEVPYALTEYLEAKFQRVAYEKAAELTDNAGLKSDLAAKALEFRSQMDDAHSRMGELTFMSEEIDGFFS